MFDIRPHFLARINEAPNWGKNDVAKAEIQATWDHESGFRLVYRAFGEAKLFVGL